VNIYGQLFFTFTKIGAFTIGGGYAMLPLIQTEVVEREKWVETKEFLDMVAISQSLPGIFSVNLSILTGYKLKKSLGSVVAALGTILPSFLIILLVAAFFRHFNENIYVAKAFRAIRPAVVALIAVPVFKTAKEVGINLKTVIIPVLTACLIWFCGVSPVYVVLAAAAGGICFMKFKNSRGSCKTPGSAGVPPANS
jgi:chromate transporter